MQRNSISFHSTDVSNLLTLSRRKMLFICQLSSLCSSQFFEAALLHNAETLFQVYAFWILGAKVCHPATKVTPFLAPLNVISNFCDLRREKGRKNSFVLSFQQKFQKRFTYNKLQAERNLFPTHQHFNQNLKSHIHFK